MTPSILTKRGWEEMKGIEVTKEQIRRLANIIDSSYVLAYIKANTSEYENWLAERNQEITPQKRVSRKGVSE